MSRGGTTAVGEAARKGLAWELAMHNPDGGWPGMAYGLKSKPPGPLYTKPTPLPRTPLGMLKMFLNPPVELGDPSTSDLTGRVLCGLRYFDYRRGDSLIDQAVDFCRIQRNPAGVWWGRWAVNYLFGSAYVICGLKAIGEDMNSPYIQQAVSWITDRQNEDGGWGESVASYTDLSLAGVGPSQASLTGQVLSALIDASEKLVAASTKPHTCPKSGQLSLAGKEQSCQKTASHTAELMRQAAAKVQFTYLVGEKECRCPVEAARLGKELGKKKLFVVGEQKTCCEKTARLNLARAKYKAAIKAMVEAQAVAAKPEPTAGK